MNKIAIILAAGASLLAFAAPASATVNVGSNSYDVGDSFVINFDGNSNSTPVPGLTAQLTMTFAGIVGGDYSFTYTLFDNSSVTSRVSGFAFDTNPNITGGTATGLFTNLFTNGSYPNGVGGVEVCLNSGGNSCQGGGNGGVTMGNSGNGSFTLDFGNITPNSITLSNFYDRYQSLANGGSGTGAGTPTDPLPEPGTWAMMLLGFGAVGVAMRRSRRKTQLVSQLA